MADPGPRKWSQSQQHQAGGGMEQEEGKQEGGLGGGEGEAGCETMRREEGVRHGEDLARGGPLGPGQGSCLSGA